jgi:Na+/proline symporter
VIYALVSVVGFLSYAFKGIGKFATDMLPWQLSANEYALILMAITTFYVVKGGMFSVVVTEVIQFCILSTASIVLGVIAMSRVSPEMIRRAVPLGWDRVSFGWRLDLDWSALIGSVNARIAEDGYSIFGFFFMMLLFKGFLVSAAGPAPNYDMQRILSTRSPREASLMNMWVNVVLIFPLLPDHGPHRPGPGLLQRHHPGHGQPDRPGDDPPDTLVRFVPAGLLGLLVAGLLAAFMSNFAPP